MCAIHFSHFVINMSFVCLPLSAKQLDDLAKAQAEWDRLNQADQQFDEELKKNIQAALDAHWAGHDGKHTEKDIKNAVFEVFFENPAFQAHEVALDAARASLVRCQALCFEGSALHRGLASLIALTASTTSLAGHRDTGHRDTNPAKGIKVKSLSKDALEICVALTCNVKLCKTGEGKEGKIRVTVQPPTIFMRRLEVELPGKPFCAESECEDEVEAIVEIIKDVLPALKTEIAQLSI